MSDRYSVDKPEARRHEVRIQWGPDHHPENFAGSYVREAVTGSPHRKTRPRHLGIVAWAVLGPEAKKPGRSDYFDRRVWWRAPHDPYGDGKSYQGGPCEQVDPLTIRAGQPSRLPNWTNRTPAP